MRTIPNALQHVITPYSLSGDDTLEILISGADDMGPNWSRVQYARNTGDSGTSAITVDPDFEDDSEAVEEIEYAIHCIPRSYARDGGEWI